MKQAFFFVDDVLWCFRDVARERPASLFDNRYFKMLKRCHDEWGATVQLNIFFREDFFYGGGEFCLRDMPSDYRAEFEANSHWLKLAFHAKQEFPDYPYVNADYEQVKHDYLEVINEIRRFAGEGSIAHAIVPHWLPISREGVQALYDCGVRFISPSVGPTTEYTGDESVLPYGHAARLRHNRKPETKLFTRQTRDERIRASICAYNHISDEQYASICHTNASILDEETGMRWKKMGGGPTLNLNSVEDIRASLIKQAEDGVEFSGTGNHEQYYYEDYFNYQPDMEEKYYTMAKTYHDLGYTFITADDFK